MKRKCAQTGASSLTCRSCFEIVVVFLTNDLLALLLNHYTAGGGGAEGLRSVPGLSIPAFLPPPKTGSIIAKFTAKLLTVAKEDFTILRILQFHDFRRSAKHLLRRYPPSAPPAAKPPFTLFINYVHQFFDLFFSNRSSKTWRRCGGWREGRESPRRPI